jgi:hypothetical protein
MKAPQHPGRPPDAAPNGAMRLPGKHIAPNGEVIVDPAGHPIVVKPVHPAAALTRQGWSGCAAAAGWYRTIPTTSPNG